MEHRDTLLTIAEIAIALAGFASIVTVLAHREDESSRAADAARLRMMLEIALRNAGFALLPLPFLQFAPSDPGLWRIGSGAYLAVALVYGVIRIRSQKGLNPSWFTLTIQTLLAATAVVSLANMLGLGGDNSFSLYLANLLIGLSVAGLAFLTVAVSVLEDTRASP